MVDCGEKPMESANMPVSVDKKKVYYPSFRLEGDAAKILSEYKPGDVCRIALAVKIKSIEERDNGMSVSMDVMKAGDMGKGTVSKEDYVNMTEDERAKHDKENMEMDEDEESEEDA